MVLCLSCVGCLKAGRLPLLGHSIRAQPVQRLWVKKIPPGPWTKRERVVEAASSFVNGAALSSGGVLFDSDPLGFVQASLWSVSVDMDVLRSSPGRGGAEILRALEEENKFYRRGARPGDLAFWGLKADNAAPTKLLAIGIVQEIDQEGTARVMGYFSDGPQRIRMNLARGKEALSDSFDVDGPKRAHELFVGYANPF